MEEDVKHNQEDTVVFVHPALLVKDVNIVTHAHQIHAKMEAYVFHQELLEDLDANVPQVSWVDCVKIEIRVLIMDHVETMVHA